METNFYFSYIKDSLGQNYFGIKVPNTVVEPYLRDMKIYLSNDELYDTMFTNKQNRDGDTHYHITILSVMELNKNYSVALKKIEYLLNKPVTNIALKGVGKATRESNTTFFIVAESTQLGAIRDELGLEAKDFHITIGFNKKDVFGVRKNSVLIIPSEIEQFINSQVGSFGHMHWIRDIKNLPNSIKNIDVRDFKFVKYSEFNAHFTTPLYKFGVMLNEGEPHISYIEELK